MQRIITPLVLVVLFALLLAEGLGQERRGGEKGKAEAKPEKRGDDKEKAKADSAPATGSAAVLSAGEHSPNRLGSVW